MAQLDWAKIQSRLKELGFDPGPLDGIRGPKTNKAVLAFQKKRRLVVDGIVGNKTYHALFDKPRASAQSVATAAQLIALAYDLHPRKETDADTQLSNNFELTVTKRCKIKGVEAYMLNNDTLLIPGSNSLNDYLKFNLRIWGLGTKRLTFREEAKKQKVNTKTKLGFSRTIWHQGFLRHAQQIHGWIGNNPHDWPKAIIGHSLGAAAAQILSKTWAAPAIGFAAPRPRKSHGEIALDGLSLSICRDDDIVCYLPSKFHRTGQSATLRHKDPQPGLNHNMKAYIDALNNRTAGSVIPDIWDP